jgi:general stress protein YciG
MDKPRLPKSVLEFFKETGAQGGKARAERHSKEQLAEWGKKGGRPKGSGKDKPKGEK